MTKRPEHLIYSVDELPPFGKLIILGLQQFCIISIYLVLVVVIFKAAKVPHTVVQNGVSVAMIALAIGAALQALWKGPIGSGYLAAPVVSAIYLQPSLLAVSSGGLPLVFGLTIVAGLFESIISGFFYLLRSFCPPVISGLIILAVGFELGLIGAEHLLDVEESIHAADYQRHLFAGIATLAFMVSLTIWGKGTVRLISALLGMFCGWGIAALLGLVDPLDLRLLHESPLFALPRFDLVSYSFDEKLIIPFLIGGLAAGLRAIGVVTTCQKINDADWKRPQKESIKKGMLADGLTCMIGGLLGVPGQSSSPSAVGISQVTLATSRYIAFALAGWFLLFSSIPKVSALFIAIPTSVVGGTLMFTGSMMLVSGLQIIASRPLDIRKTFVVGISIFLGLSHKIFPNYFAQLPEFIRLFTGTTLSITTIVSLTLYSIFRIKSRQSIQLQIDKSGLDKADQLIKKNVEKWGGNIEDAGNVSSFVRMICSVITEGGYATSVIKAQVNYDETKLFVDIYYQGQLLQLPTTRPPIEDDMLAEIPMSKGLSGFLSGVYPDRITSSADNDECHLRLIFEL